ncbi:hypothetical protein D3C72_1579650 [compost metagenome]
MPSAKGWHASGSSQGQIHGSGYSGHSARGATPPGRATTDQPSVSRPLNTSADTQATAATSRHTLRNGDALPCRKPGEGSGGNAGDRGQPDCQCRTTIDVGTGGGARSPRTSQSMNRTPTAKAMTAVSHAQTPGMSTKPAGVSIGSWP